MRMLDEKGVPGRSRERRECVAGRPTRNDPDVLQVARRVRRAMRCTIAPTSKSVQLRSFAGAGLRASRTTPPLPTPALACHHVSDVTEWRDRVPP